MPEDILTLIWKVVIHAYVLHRGPRSCLHGSDLLSIPYTLSSNEQEGCKIE
jgi:hypothetical protein